MIKNDDGFSLVEVLVALVIVAILGISLTLIFVNISNSYNKQTAEAETMIEIQTLTNNLEDSIKSCTAYSQIDNIIEIELTKGNQNYWYYYKLSDDNYVYLKSFDEKQDVNLISFDNKDFLARYIKDITLSPSHFDSNKTNDLYIVEYSVTSFAKDEDYTLNSKIAIRNGH